jgi:hypothetical protein
MKLVLTYQVLTRIAEEHVRDKFTHYNFKLIMLNGTPA